MKNCSRCAQRKPLTEFHKARSATGQCAARGGMGVSAQCKQCRAEARKPGVNAERADRERLAVRGLKVCRKCQSTRPFTDFHKRAASPDGLAYKCVACVNATTTAWRSKNPGAWQRWYAENRSTRLEYVRTWDANNRELKSAIYKKWEKENPQKRLALNAKRMAKKVSATPRWANQDAIEAIYAEAVRLTQEIGIRHKVDHIVPLQGEIVTGLHWEKNLQVITKAENIRKHNRHWPDMPC